MYSKAQIFNLSLSALLLSRQISNPDTDTSNEGKVLQTHWNSALRSTLADLDLDTTAVQKDLSLVEEDPNDLWSYAYKYPVDCAFFRRIVSNVDTDNSYTHIAKKIGLNSDYKKVIFTNESDAVADYIPFDVPISVLNANAGLALAYRLAELSAPLIVGKGASKLRKEIREMYAVYKAEAQEMDKWEGMRFLDDRLESEFVAARME